MLSSRLLELSVDSRLSSFAGKKLLNEIEGLPSEEERVLVMNATTSIGLAGRGVLALHRQRITTELLARLFALGVDVGKTFPIEVRAGDDAPIILHGANIFHLAAVEGALSLLERLPRRKELFDARAASGETPLCLALKYGSITKKLRETIKLLDGWGADRTARDDADREAFHYTLQYPGSNLLDALVKCWERRNILPISRYEAQTGLALALLGPPTGMERSVAILKELVTRTEASEKPTGVPVLDLIQYLNDLVPRKAEEEARRDHGSRESVRARSAHKPTSSLRSRRI